MGFTYKSDDQKWYADSILDLDGNGLQITELSQSTHFVDATGDGLQNRTAWAGAGDAVLFYDPNNLNDIVETSQYVFTEWDPTAARDIEALRAVFDSNGDGVSNASDAAFADFKLMVTNADGSTSMMTLAAAGITEIDLTGDAMHIELPDGSVITGQTTFTRDDGSTGTVGDVTLVADGRSYRVEQSLGEAFQYQVSPHRRGAWIRLRQSERGISWLAAVNTRGNKAETCGWF